MTSYELLYQSFFNLIEKDEKYFNYNNVSVEDALLIAKSRAKNYLLESVSKLKLKCSLDIDIQFNDDLESLTVDLTQVEVDLIASLMYERYLFRDTALLKTMVNALTSSDIKILYAPANERKTFMDMYKSIKDDNEVYMDDYNGRDRNTGSRKLIDYNSFEV